MAGACDTLSWGMTAGRANGCAALIWATFHSCLALLASLLAYRHGIQFPYGAPLRSRQYHFVAARVASFDEGETCEGIKAS